MLRPSGRLLCVEPWQTPFLRCVHAVSASPARHAWDKLDAFQQLYEHEHTTYDNWRSRPAEITGLLERHFTAERVATRWGKLMWMGRN